MNCMPVEFLGIIEHTMELGISYYTFWYKASYCKCPGMKIENWDAATCRTSSFYNSIVYSHSSHLEVLFVQDRPFWFHHLFPPLL